MIEGFIYEWANLLIRWIHFIVGVAWIGASFYFNWLENNLDRRPSEDAIAGNLWAIHGGGFYHLKKFKTGPQRLPAQLHWFKWEAYTTWLSGVTLLIVVYYFNARLFLIDPSVMALGSAQAITIAVVSVIGSWFVYDGLCRSALHKTPWLLTIALVLYLSLLAYFLSEVFSGRGAYIHVGAAIGTLMVGNVFFVIIPAQKQMVAAVKQQRAIDPSLGKKGLLRSTHNNYLTLPVLFLMISSHFPSTYSHSWNWLVLIFISLISVAVRHYFNVRHVIKSLWWLLPAAFVAMLLVMWMTAPAPHIPTTTSTLTHQEKADASLAIETLIQTRCTACHSESPTQSGFSVAPAGVVLDNLEQMVVNAERIYQAAVVNKTMPIANLTKMTEQERNLIARWYTSLH